MANVFPPCSTCKKAHQWFVVNGIEVHIRDIKVDNPSVAALQSWHGRSGLQQKRFFNTSDLKYNKELGIKCKLTTMSETEQYDLLANDGMIVKRPLVLTDTAVLVGFR